MYLTAKGRVIQIAGSAEIAELQITGHLGEHTAPSTTPSGTDIISSSSILDYKGPRHVYMYEMPCSGPQGRR